MAGKATAQAVEIIELRQTTGLFTVEGVTPLIVHNWSRKAKQEMLDKQMGKAKPKKDPKDPTADYNDSRYRLDNKRDGFPAVAFKSAIVGAARLFEGITMTALRGSIFVYGEGPELLVPIVGKPEMREDMVRIGSGTADIRYRAAYYPWSAKLKIRWVESAFTVEQMLALVNAAGIGGVGEWRPSKSAGGQYGMFTVTDGNVTK
jgi:hypothetical protein